MLQRYEEFANQSKLFKEKVQFQVAILAKIKENDVLGCKFSTILDVFSEIIGSPAKPCVLIKKENGENATAE